MKRLLILLLPLLLTSCDTVKEMLIYGPISGNGNTAVNSVVSKTISTLSMIDDSETALMPGADSSASSIHAATLPTGVTGPDANGWYTINPAIIGEDLDQDDGITIKQKTIPDMYDDAIFNKYFVSIQSTDTITLNGTLKFTGITDSSATYNITSTYTQVYSSPTSGAFIDPVTEEQFSSFFYSKLEFSNDKTTGTITVGSTVYSITETYDDAILDLATSEFDTEAGNLQITTSDNFAINVTFDATGEGTGTLKKDNAGIGKIYFSYYEEEDEYGTFEEDAVYYTLDTENNKIPHSIPVEFIP